MYPVVIVVVLLCGRLCAALASISFVGKSAAPALERCCKRIRDRDRRNV